MKKGENLKLFNKKRIGRTYEDIFGAEKAKIMKEKISKAVREYSLKIGRIPPSRKGTKDSVLTRERKSIGHKGINVWTKKLFWL